MNDLLGVTVLVISSIIILLVILDIRAIEHEIIREELRLRKIEEKLSGIRKEKL